MLYIVKFSLLCPVMMDEMGGHCTQSTPTGSLHFLRKSFTKSQNNSFNYLSINVNMSIVCM